MAQWDSIPLLPLRCTLEHLSLEDALAAMSTCRHWRNAVLLYEGRKETLKLLAKNLEKNLFLARIFRRHTRKLYVYIDCSAEELEKFMNFVLPQFFEAAKLQELIFIGPMFLTQTHHVPVVKLKRIITETLVFKHMECIQKLAFVGCAMGALDNENETFTNKHIENYSRPLTFSKVLEPADSILCSANQHLMQFSTLNHIVVDYDQVNTTALETLSHMSNFRHLTLNILGKKKLKPIDWLYLRNVYAEPLQVTVNIISVPYRRLHSIMTNVLVEGLRLVSLKVMFCKTLYTPLLSHVSCLYRASLRELVWADSPHEHCDAGERALKPPLDALEEPPEPGQYTEVNQFVILCWQCENLSRLVIHGYWVWHYDLLGFVRLRKSLMYLEISAIYIKRSKFDAKLHQRDAGTVRVLYHETPSAVNSEYIKEINKISEFKWNPVPWHRLHPALRGRCSPQQRADYIAREAAAPLGVT